MRLHAIGIGLLGVGVSLVQPTVASAQTFAFKLEKGEKLYYEYQQRVAVEGKSGQETFNTTSTVRQLRQWEVLDVDKLGVATLELTFVKLQIEMAGDGEKIAFDSANPANPSDPFAQKMSKLIGKPVRRVAMAPNGAVKDSKNLTDEKNFSIDLPFVITTPDEPLQMGSHWQAPFPISMESTLGGGDAIKAVQQSEVVEATSDRVVVSTEIRLEKPAEKPQEKMALMQFLTKGKVTLEPAIGRMRTAELSASGRVDGFAGKDSYYSFKSVSREQLVELPATQSANGGEAGVKK